jgi:hypothetical protein
VGEEESPVTTSAVGEKETAAQQRTHTHAQHTHAHHTRTRCTPHTRTHARSTSGRGPPPCHLPVHHAAHTHMHRHASWAPQRHARPTPHAVAPPGSCAPHAPCRRFVMHAPCRRARAPCVASVPRRVPPLERRRSAVGANLGGGVLPFFSALHRRSTATRLYSPTWPCTTPRRHTHTHTHGR